MRILWDHPRTLSGLSSRQVWLAVNKALRGQRYLYSRGTISRASIINFLNDMVDREYLDFEEVTGKGGHRRLYYSNVYSEEEFKTAYAHELIRHVGKEFGITVRYTLEGETWKQEGVVLATEE